MVLTKEAMCLGFDIVLVRRVTPMVIGTLKKHASYCEDVSTIYLLEWPLTAIISLSISLSFLNFNK